MQNNYKEIYSKDKKELSDLIQEWIEENILDIYYKCNISESVNNQKQ